MLSPTNPVITGKIPKLYPVMRFRETLKEWRGGGSRAGLLTLRIFASSAYTLMSSRAGAKFASGTRLTAAVHRVPSLLAFCVLRNFGHPVIFRTGDR